MVENEFSYDSPSGKVSISYIGMVVAATPNLRAESGINLLYRYGSRGKRWTYYHQYCINLLYRYGSCRAKVTLKFLHLYQSLI